MSAHYAMCKYDDDTGSYIPLEVRPITDTLKKDDPLYQDGFQAGAASRDAEVARLKTVPMKYRRMAFNAQLQDEVARLEQENDQLRAQIKQKDAEIADLLEANRIACEDLVEQQNLRVKYAGQIAELVAALEHILAGSLSLPRFAEAEAIAVIASVKAEQQRKMMECAAKIGGYTE